MTKQLERSDLIQLPGLSLDGKTLDESVKSQIRNLILTGSRTTAPLPTVQEWQSFWENSPDFPAYFEHELYEKLSKCSTEEIEADSAYRAFIELPENQNLKSWTHADQLEKQFFARSSFIKNTVIFI